MSYLDVLTNARNSQICIRHLVLLNIKRSPIAHNYESMAASRRFYRSDRDLSWPSSVQFFSHTVASLPVPSEDDKSVGPEATSSKEVDRSIVSSVTARDFLLSISGLFDSGRRDGSASVKRIVSEMIDRKYGSYEDGNVS